MIKKLIRKMLTAAGGPIKKFRTRDVNGNWVYMDISTGRTTSAAPESGTIRTNTVNSIGGDVKTKLGRTRIALNQVTSYNNRQYKVHNYADTRTRLQLKNQNVVLDKQGEPEIVQADYTPTLEAPMKIVSPEFDLLTLGRLAVTSVYNASKPTINVMADTAPEVKSATTLSLEQIEKAFELARLWHLNRINSPGYTNRALRAGFTEEEIPLLQLQLTSLINRLKLSNPEELFEKVNMKRNYNGKASAGYWKTINNEGKLLLGIRFDNPNMSYDDAVSTFVHEFGHGATFGLNGNETTGYMKLLSDLFPLLTRAVKYNKTLYPEVNENIVTQVMPKVGNNARYYADPSEMLSRGYEFMRDYANNFFKLKNSEGFTTQNVIDNAANTRINSKIFRALTGNLGAFNFLKYALGTAAPIGLGYNLVNNNENQLQLQYQKLGGKMNILEFLKQGGQIRKMLTAAGGPIELYDTLWVDNWKNRLTSPTIVAKQLTELTSKIPIKYLGGSKDNVRKEFWKQEPVFQHAVDSIANQYGISPESLKYRLDKEGFTDRLIQRRNNRIKIGALRFEPRGYELLNNPNYGLDGTQIGLDDAKTYIDSGKVKLINENWDERGPFKNEKGRMTYPVNPVTLNDGMGIVAAHLKYFRDEASLDFPNGSEYDLDRYANAYYNRGTYGGKKWVLAGAKGYSYRKKGGMLEFLKNGSGIHIKKKNRGSFTRWCGGNVTEECIRRGKASSNPKIRKKATFADNVRHFKHRLGGILYFLLEGGNLLNSGSALINGIGAGILYFTTNNQLSKMLNEFNKSMKAKYNFLKNNINMKAINLLALQNIANLKLTNPEQNFGTIDLQLELERLRKEATAEAEQLAKYLIALELSLFNNLINAIKGENTASLINGIFNIGKTALLNYKPKNNKTNIQTTTVLPKLTTNTYTSNYSLTTPSLGLFNTPLNNSLKFWNV